MLPWITQRRAAMNQRWLPQCLRAVPEGEDIERPHSGGSGKHVSVGGSQYDDETVGMSKEEREKHIAFQEARKKHYEMKDVRGLLG